MTTTTAATIPPLHAIAGAGQLGPLIARQLVARGLRVRLIRRRPLTDLPPGIEAACADLSDPASARDALRGASVVYHCANPRYDRWQRELVPLARGITEGAAAAGARLVVLDNVYMYRLSGDGRLAEDTPIAPVSRKGALRAEAAALMLEAHARGDVAVAIARAADFMGPACETSVLGERFWTRLLAGKPVEVLGDPDQPHSYSYIPDVADGLVTLGVADPALPDGEGVYGKVWHLPALPAESTRTWLERFAAAVGVAPRLTKLSPLFLRALGLVMPAAGELPEMIYQWRTPYRLDDARFRARFGATPTDAATVVRETVAWARTRFAPRNQRAAA